MERTGAKGMTGRVALVLVSLLVGVLVGWMLNTQISKEAAVGRVSVGPHHIEDGVPVRYAQTREGAISAANNYARVLSGPLLADPGAYMKANEILASKKWVSARQDAQKDLDALENKYQLAAKRAQGLQVAIESSVLRYRLDSFSKTKAVVSYWLVGIIDPGDAMPDEIWTSGIMTLTYEEGDWKVMDLKKLEPIVPRQLQTSSGEGVGIKGFTGFDYAPPVR